MASYLFVDGGYFTKAVERICTDVLKLRDPLIDPSRLFRKFDKAFYYDCPVFRKQGEGDQAFQDRQGRQDSWFTRLAAVDGLHLLLGQTSGEGRRIRQKGVDIMIAVDMLTHAIRKNADTMTLLTGDLDFKPLINSLVQLGVDVTIWADRYSASSELLRTADHRRPLNSQLVVAALPVELSVPLRYPAPSATNESYLDDKVKLKSGRAADGEVVSMYQTRNGFSIVVVDRVNIGNVRFLEHSDEAFLNAVFEDVFFPVKWE